MNEATKDNFMSLGCARYCVSKNFNKLKLVSKLYSTHCPLSYAVLYEGPTYNSEGFGSELMRNFNKKDNFKK